MWCGKAVERARALVGALSEDHGVPAPAVEVRGDLAAVAARFNDRILLHPTAPQGLTSKAEELTSL